MGNLEGMIDEEKDERDERIETQCLVLAFWGLICAGLFLRQVTTPNQCKTEPGTSWRSAENNCAGESTLEL